MPETAELGAIAGCSVEVAFSQKSLVFRVSKAECARFRDQSAFMAVGTEGQVCLTCEMPFYTKKTLKYFRNGIHPAQL